VALVIALGLAPWVALLLAKHGSGFFYEFFVVHNLQRFGGDMGNSQSGFMGYYLIVLMIGFFPWVAFVGPALTALVKNPLGVAHKLPFKKALRSGLASADINTALPLLAFAWAIVYVGIFSFSGTKLAHYIVPAYPALAIGVAGWLVGSGRKVIPVWQVLVWGFIGFALTGIALIATPLVEGLRSTPLTGWLADAQLLFGFEWPPSDMQAAAVLRQGIPLSYGFYEAGFAILLATVALMLVMRGKARFLSVLGIVWALALMIIALKVVPVVWAYTQYPLAYAAQSLRSFPSGTVLVHHGLHKPSVRLLSGMPFIKTDSPVQVISLLQNLPSGAHEIWVVVEVQDIQPLLAELKTARAGVVLDAKCIAGTCLVGLAPVTPGLNP
jgi:4-amino-4-deoxy-L-arabinose transferase-like glycosyltransferase